MRVCSAIMRNSAAMVGCMPILRSFMTAHRLIKKVGYSAIYGNAMIAPWNQRALHRNESLLQRGLMTRATTPSLWRGFRMMQPAWTTLTGFDGRAALNAHRVTAPRAGA